jgi:hypothetical protein
MGEQCVRVVSVIGLLSCTNSDEFSAIEGQKNSQFLALAAADWLTSIG